MRTWRSPSRAGARRSPARARSTIVTRNRPSRGNSTINLTGSFGVQIQQTAVRRLSDPQQCRGGRGAGQRLRRELAQHRAEHPVQRGQRLHGRHSRPPGRGAARAQPRIPRRAGACRALAFRGRRGYPHRRRPGRGQPFDRCGAAGRGARPGRDQCGDLPADRRRGARQARRRGAAAKAVAQEHRFGAGRSPMPSIRRSWQPASGRCGRLCREVQPKARCCRSSRPMPVCRRATAIPIPRLPSGDGNFDFRRASACS